MSEIDIAELIDDAEFVPGELPEDHDFQLKLSFLPHNDLGNMQRLQRRFGEDLMYVANVGWYGWTGTHWSLESGEVKARHLARQTAEQIRKEARAVLQAGPRDAELPKDFEKRVQVHRRWAATSGNDGRLNQMLNCLRFEQQAQVDALDAPHYAFNVQNGTLDLEAERAGGTLLRRHRREDLLTRVSPVHYDPAARAPRFMDFLHQVAPDASLQLFLQRYFGYAMTGDTSEQVLLLLYGRGANGKSTLTDIIAHVLGSYVAHLNFASLLHDDRRRGSEASPDIAKLPGARTVMASEPERNARFSEGLVKQLTGGDAVTARRHYQDFFEFKPQFKLVLSANEMPRITGQEDGVWRRMLVAPFTQYIPPEQRDKHLTEKLLKEAPGILNWLLDGARMWMDDGLCVPDVVREAVKEYRSENDPVGEFIEACCEIGHEREEEAGLLYRSYEQYAKDNGQDPVSHTAFGKALTAKGYVTKRGRKRMRLGLSVMVDCAPTSAGGGWGDM